MKKILSIISLAVLTVGLLCSCSKINERIDDLDKRIYDIENDKIASVEQQITAIKESIADLETIRRNHPDVEFLSDAKRVWLDEVRGEIPEEDFLRAEYVIGEVQRVLDVCDALERGDYETVGEMMYQTHFGLSRLYEVSCEELDFLNRLARRLDVTGSRVMGGGFGGCTINLVKDELYRNFVDTAISEFTERFGKTPKIYDVVVSDGARQI